MSTHSEEHCKKPSLRFKRLGTMWRCDCGKYWYVSKKYGYDFHSAQSEKKWIDCTARYRDEELRSLERRQDSYQSSVDSLRRDYDGWTKKVYEAFDQASKDVQELQARITALESKKVNRGSQPTDE